jgi:hypothetical protein
MNGLNKLDLSCLTVFILVGLKEAGTIKSSSKLIDQKTEHRIWPKNLSVGHI